MKNEKIKFDPTKKNMRELVKLSRLYGVKVFTDYGGDTSQKYRGRFVSIDKDGFIEFQVSWTLGKENAKAELVRLLETKYKRKNKKRVIKK